MGVDLTGIYLEQSFIMFLNLNLGREDEAMKKTVLVSIVVFAVFCFASSASAGSLAPGGKTSCNNASSITLEANGSHSTDRENANAVIWKSSNFTTIPITLGNDEQGIPGKGPNSKAHTQEYHSMGAKKVTLKGQNNFSRGDSIGDISGEVRITNTGTIPMNVTCN